jgi:hypothetical protein
MLKKLIPILGATIILMGLMLMGCPNPTDTAAGGSAKAITVFDFTSPAATGIISEGNHTITLIVPYGTDVTALAPTITHTGASINPASGAARDFTDPVSYTVTAADNSTQTYSASVTVAAESSKAITAFNFNSPAVTGTINESANTITLTLPNGANIASLTPTIAITGVKITPLSGVAQDFTNPVTYTVRAANASIQTYTVTVLKNPAKAITAFTFPSSTGTVITESNHTIAARVLYGTNVTTLVPAITITGVTVIPASGVEKDFTNPVTYTVTADDGTTQIYTVTVTVDKNTAKAITAFNVASPAATGTIDEANHTVNLYYATGTVVTALVPTITVSEKASITPLSGAAKDFSSPVTYTVTADNGTTQDYTVSVSFGAPPTVTTTAIIGNFLFTQNILGTSAIGGGNVTDQGVSPVTERGICWSTSANPTISNSHSADGSGTGVFTNAAMTGLVPDTTYHVRAYATNSLGTAYGSDITFNSGKTMGTVYQNGRVFYNDSNGHGTVSAMSDLSSSASWSTAVQLCNDYNDGTYSDWYLPSKDELNLMFIRLDSIYNFFAQFGYYWSSTYYYPDLYYWEQDFMWGDQGYTDMNYKLYVRAARAF